MFDSLEGFQYERGEKSSETKAARAFGEKKSREVSQGKPPVDIFNIIENNYQLNLIKKSMDDDISAIVDLDNNEIIINKNKIYVHQRFTLAHELGHILLNHKQRKWTDFSINISTSSNPDQPLEEEANAFAAGFLMPKYLIKKYVDLGTKPKQLAYLFEVSEQAMWYSLHTYRLINKVMK